MTKKKVKADLTTGMVSGWVDSRSDKDKLNDAHNRLNELTKEIQRLRKMTKLPTMSTEDIEGYKNIYNSPEAVNAEIVAELGDGGGYDWALLVVFRDKSSGRLFFRWEAGCSCYGFCECVHSLAELDEITKKTEDWVHFKDEVGNFSESYTDAASKVEFLSKIDKMLNT